MVMQHNKHQEKITLEKFFDLVESDPEHRYELIAHRKCTIKIKGILLR